MSFSDLALKGIAASGAAVYALGWSDFLNDEFFIPIFNVPIAIIVSAAIGSGLSLVWGDPVRGRRMLLGQITASTIVGATGAALLAHAFGWGWAQEKPGAFALCAACIVRLLMPVAIKNGKRLLGEVKIPWNKKSDENQYNNFDDYKGD